MYHLTDIVSWQKGKKMDLIDRQKAIDALNDEITITGKANAIVVQDYVRRVRNRLHELPSAQKTGKWIIEPYDDDLDMRVFRCSNCLKPSGIGGRKRGNKKWEWFDFCPNCGARMVEE